MKKFNFCLKLLGLFIVIMLLYRYLYAQDQPYLGQTPPGRILRPFAPSIIPNDLHCTTTVSPDGQEIYWTNNSAIIMTKFRDGRWTTPEVVSFSGGGTTFTYDDNPVVSQDNKKLFFTSLRPISFPTGNSEHIWYVERTPSGWSEPQPLPQLINSTPGIHWQVSVSNSGTLFFGTTNFPNKIFFSLMVNGEYTSPEPLTEINQFGNVFCPFIAPDESYIIFSMDVNSQGYMYISFKSQNHQWLQPQRIAQIPPGIVCSFVSRDGEYLFVNNHWISAEILDDYATGIEDENNDKGPKIFQLDQNYPNPFNSSTNIRFELSKPSELSILIYDIQGKFVQLLASKQLWSPGSHLVTWNGLDEHGKGVSSGQYFYKIDIGGFSEIKKMLILQ